MLLPWVLIVGAAVYGAAAGALLPRAVHRLAVEPGRSWRSACPAGHPLGTGVRAWTGPVRCVRCSGGQPEPAASPATAPSDLSDGPGPDPVPLPERLRGGGGQGVLGAAGALVSAALASAVGARPELAVWLLLVPFGLLLAAVDREVKRLPDILTLPLAGATAALLGLAALLPDAGGDWVRALLGGVVLAAVFFVLFFISPSGMGFGDVKLALTLGVALGWYGWDVLFAGAFLGFLSAAGYGVALILAKRAGRGTALAFGPFMVLGALAGVVLGGIAA